ncbi:MAG TPA: hypothetical protein VIZ29_09510 [Gaiellaceae bacterium]
MIARMTPYRVPPAAVEPLIEEIVALARARSRWPVERTNRRAEFFFLNTSSGDGLSLLLGDDRTVTPAIELARPASEDPKEYDVHLLQVGGPRTSGVVEALFGRVVRCDPAEAGELSFNGDAVPTSEDVWARALLVAPSGRVVTFAVAADRKALETALIKFSARCTRIDDYDEVAYHFFVDADYER